MRYCRYCGMPVEDDDLFCTRCGKPVKDNSGNGTGGAVIYEYENEDDDDSGEYPEEDFLYDDEPASGTGYGMARREPERLDAKRKALIFSALCILLVLGILFFMLLSSSKKNTDAAADSTETVREEAGPDTEQSRDSAESPDREESPDENRDEQASEDSAEETEEAETQKAEADERGQQDGIAEVESILKTGEKEEEEEEKTRDETAEQEEEQEDSEEEDSEEELTQEENEEDVPRGTDGSYVLSDSDSRYYSRSELEYLDDYSLQMAINEIYARHGRIFTTPAIREYFENKSWYRGTIEPGAFDGNEGAYFNEYEQANRELLAQIRASREDTAPSAEGTPTLGGSRDD